VEKLFVKSEKLLDVILRIQVEEAVKALDMREVE